MRPGGLIATQTFSLVGLPVVPFAVPNPPAPVDVSLGSVTVPSIDLYALDPTEVSPGSVLNLTLAGPVTLHADPTNGSAGGAVSGYGDATVITGLGTFNCQLGDVNNLITASPSTDNPGGARYDAATAAITVADAAVHVPALTCDGPLGSTVAGVVNIFAGLPTDSGTFSLTGVVHPVPPATTPPSTQPSTTQPQVQQQPSTQPAARRCVVPKLKGKKLKRAKKVLKKAHCRLGTVKKKKRPSKAGRVLSQKPKPHTRLPAGGRVAVVVGKR